MESRLVVHVFRELRRKQLKLEKGKGGKDASVSVAQLKKSFPSLSTYEITSRLRDRCECQPLPVSSLYPSPSMIWYSNKSSIMPFRHHPVYRSVLLSTPGRLRGVS